jgi:hypothetical protein
MIIKDNRNIKLPIVKCLESVIEDFQKRNKLLESGNKQILDEVKLLIKDRETLRLMLGVILESHKKGHSELNKPIAEKVRVLLEQYK